MDKGYENGNHEEKRSNSDSERGSRKSKTGYESEVEAGHKYETTKTGIHRNKDSSSS